MSRFQLVMPGIQWVHVCEGVVGRFPEAIARHSWPARDHANADASDGTRAHKCQPSAANGTVVRFGQKVDGVPVFGARSVDLTGVWRRPVGGQ